jgi:hypothetical protein
MKLNPLRAQLVPLAASQASLNEIVAAIIRDGPADRWQAGNALNALRYHNWASGFTFEGEPASDAPWDRPLQDAAVRKTRGLEAGKRYRAKLAQAVYAPEPWRAHLIGTLAASTSAAAQPVSSWTGRSRSNAPGP